MGHRNNDEFYRDKVDRQYEQIAEKLESAGFRLHHTAKSGPYMARYDGCQVDEYHGKFGNGYIVRKPSWSSYYYHYVSYYVK